MESFYIFAQGFPSTLPLGASLDLASTKSISLTDCTLHTLFTGQSVPEDWQRELLVLEKCGSSREGVFVMLTVLKITPQQEITGMNPGPPCFIPKGLTIAQAILLLDQNEDYRADISVVWTQIINKNRPQLTCLFESNNKKISLTGLLDTIVNVTVISQYLQVGFNIYHKCTFRYWRTKQQHEKS